MSAERVTAPTASVSCTEPVVSGKARELAAALAALFKRDAGIVGRLSDAQRRLTAANDRLWSGLAPDAIGLIYDGLAPAGCSQIAEPRMQAPDGIAGELGHQTAMLAALQDVHWQIHGAFVDYQSACEERRQLAFDVGELSAQLSQALRCAGYSPEQARSANVHELARTGRLTRRREPGA